MNQIIRGKYTVVFAMNQIIRGKYASDADEIIDLVLIYLF
jgi:hypothetical protein